jgi:hypothetical protein
MDVFDSQVAVVDALGLTNADPEVVDVVRIFVHGLGLTLSPLPMKRHKPPGSLRRVGETLIVVVL